MLTGTLKGMKISKINVGQVAEKVVVAMCADDTTIFAGDGEDISKAKEAIQCYMDASSASINWKKTISFLSGCLLTNPPPQDMIPGKVMGPQDKARYLRAIVSRDTSVVTWENALANA